LLLNPDSLIHSGTNIGGGQGERTEQPICRPLDRRFVFEKGDQRIDIRTITIPTLYGEDATLRLLDPE